MDHTAAPAAAGPDPAPPPMPPGRIFLRFLRFGLLAWGGPVAQIAMLRRELVDEERWMAGGRFNRLLAVFQVLPGPEAHELCVHFGMMRGRRLGGFLAGLGFMLPGFVLMFALSWLYFRMDIAGSALAPVFLGVQVGVIALIVRAVHRIGGHVLMDPWLWALAAAGAGLTLFGASFWIVLPAAGVLYGLLHQRRYAWAAVALVVAAATVVLLSPLAWPELAAASASAAPGPSAAVKDVSAAALFLSGLKAGLLTFGGAYTVIPFLRDDAVGRGWMSESQFLDGVALSGVLPAPLIIFSTFVGYAAGGPLGALAMTAGIFLPAFSFSLLLFDRLEGLVDNKGLHAFLEGVSAGVVGLIAATTLELAAAVAGRLPSILPGLLIFGLALAVLYLWKSKLNILLMLAGAGCAGWLVFAAGGPNP
ncbi:MAG: chromate efflux transporter [Pseudomonadota bacterium]|nr:chromate efflux transporter [Pseudomonadota bacterium]